MIEMKERLLESERKYVEGYFNPYYGRWQEGDVVRKGREANERYELERRAEAREREEIAAGIRNPDGFLNLDHPANTYPFTGAAKTIGKKKGSKAKAKARRR